MTDLFQPDKDGFPHAMMAPSPSTYGLAALDPDFAASIRSGTANLKESSPRLVFVWKDLAVCTRSNGMVLLNYVSGRVADGFYAVMGPSGSGKTTLLNALACRLDRAMKVSGFMHINGKVFTRNDLKKMAAYVMQDDLMNAYMTVEETLMFAADLRLPRKKFAAEQRRHRVQEVAEAMGVSHIMGVIIGDALNKGVSGGERKRTAVAMELLTKPTLLFLDEPTSGLDSVMSLQLCEHLRTLTDSRTCTVVTTIHQPQTKIFKLFSNLLLLKKGSILYQGTASGALIHFDGVGAPCPAKENPADHFMDAMSVTETSERLVKAYTAPEIDLHENSDQPIIAIQGDRLSWLLQFWTLTRRAFREKWRQRYALFITFAQVVIIGIMFSGAFRPLPATNTRRVARSGALWSCIVNQGIYGTLSAVNSFPRERALVLRERAGGMYCSSAYFMAKCLADLPQQVIAPILFSISMYFLVGFQDTTQKFFFFTLMMILTNLSACGLGLVCAAVCRKVEYSLVLLSMTYEICRCFGSFFLSPSLTPIWLKWIDVLSYAKYGHIGVVMNEYSGLNFKDFNPKGLVAKGRGTNLKTGDDWLINQGYPGYITQNQCVLILFCYIILYRFVAYLGVRFVKF